MVPLRRQVKAIDETGLSIQIVNSYEFKKGIRLFNTRKYFESHEALEALWLKAIGDRKTFLHGLIQIAAAFHHHMRQNPTGLCSLLEKGSAKLELFGAEFEGVDVTGLMAQLALWKEHCKKTSQKTPPPPLPRIEFIARARGYEIDV